MSESDIRPLSEPIQPRPEFGRTVAHRATRPEQRGASRPADLNAGLIGAELGELTREELVVLAPNPGQLDRMLPPEVFPQLLARRLTVRILYSAQPEPPTAAFAALVRAGAALETSLHLPYFLLIRDRAVAYLPHQDPNHPQAGRLARVRNVVMAGSMAAAFDAIWSMSVQRSREALAGELGDAHQEVLRVLGDGLTDDRAAARLHMSKRTFARRVAMMMDRLEASSRFQAGVQAARRGWI